MKQTISKSVLVGCFLCVLTGCTNTGIKHVNASEFIRQAETMEQMNSASGTFFIGTTPTRAYIERAGLYKLFPSHKAMVYWTEIDGLPSEIREELKQGNLPWTPWEDRSLEKNDDRRIEDLGLRMQN